MSQLEHSQPGSERDVPLLVDLDGTFIVTDTLVEGIVFLLKRRPWFILNILFWLIQGKTHLKEKVYTESGLDVSSLPVRNEVLEYIQSESDSGREIILISGSWWQCLTEFKSLFPVFTSVYGSSKSLNLTGSNKAKFATEKWGSKGFDYIGNEIRDIAVWSEARSAIVVGTHKLAEEARLSNRVDKHFVIENPGIKSWVKELRVHQWAKNALIFVPLMTSHKLNEVDAVISLALGFVALSLCASATYLMNDAFDLNADRAHPIKKLRPLASGEIPLVKGILVSVVLLAIGLSISVLAVSMLFTLALIAYLLLTILYSFKLKSLQTLDVITLASLFTIRVLAGAAAIEVKPSFWLLCFSMFVFLSLAMVKRVAELVRLDREDSSTKEKIRGRGYYATDLVILQCLGATSGFLAVLVFSLYINSAEVVVLYTYPEVLWLICPILGYWIMRVWMLAARGEMNEDPISFAITDRNSWLAAIISGIVVAVASYL